MFHSVTPIHNKEVILASMEKENGFVRVVFATTALGMGVNFAGLNRTIHYGASKAIEDYSFRSLVGLGDLQVPKLSLQFTGSQSMRHYINIYQSPGMQKEQQ